MPLGGYIDMSERGALYLWQAYTDSAAARLLMAMGPAA